MINLGDVGFALSDQPALLARRRPGPGRRDAALPLHVRRGAVRRAAVDGGQRAAAASSHAALLAVAGGRPDTPFWALLLAAATAGFGGGNFSSSMANISFFYPEGRKGVALGLNAAGGNLGVAVAQLLVPLVILVGAAAALHLAYAGLGVDAVHRHRRLGAWRYMDSLRRRTTPRPVAALRHRQTWVLSILYIGAFGSFIGYSPRCRC